MLQDTFPDPSSSFVVCVCNHYRRRTHNHCLMIDLFSHLSCLTKAFSSYCVSFSFVYLNWYHSTNQISLLNLKIMGMDPGPLVNLLVVLVNLLIVSVAQALAIFFQLELNHLVTLFRWYWSYQEEPNPKVVNSKDHFGTKNLELPLCLSLFKIYF